MKKAVFLDLATIRPDDLSLAPLETLPLSWQWHDLSPPELVHERIHDADIVVANKCTLDASVIKAAGRLSHICAAATGYNHIDIDAARAAGIPVSNVRGYATASVVQHVWALILALSTHLPDYQRAVRQGAWQRSINFCLHDYPIIETQGRKLGIIGYGELGRSVAAVAPAFGMDVLIAQSLHGPATAGRLPLHELLHQADVISIHLPLTEGTRKLIGEKELKLMKPEALLINTARGGIIDESALAKALKQGWIGGAGVDVLGSEPPTDGNPLLDTGLPNLIVTPHIAWASRQSRQRLVMGIAANLRAFLDGSPRNVVN